MCSTVVLRSNSSVQCAPHRASASNRKGFKRYSTDFAHEDQLYRHEESYAAGWIMSSVALEELSKVKRKSLMSPGLLSLGWRHRSLNRKPAL